MRAGGFAERRVIDLFNRRFVAYYFNRSGQGHGGNQAASEFVDGQTDNPYAYLAAFSPEGEILGETELYADKDAIFEWAIELLDDHPEYAAASEQEQELLERASDRDDLAARMQLARLHEDLGRYADAIAAYRSLMGSKDAKVSADAGVSILRVLRYIENWDLHAQAENVLRDRFTGDDGLSVDLDIERGRRSLARGEYAAARPVLQAATRRAVGTARHAEAHFYAGVACWFCEDRPWAKFHWCYVNENLGNDRLARRAYIAAAAESMPYANPELGGFEAQVGNIGTGDIIRGYQAALRVCDGLIPLFESGANSGARSTEANSAELATTPSSADLPSSPLLLVARLRDGNPSVPKNNEIVRRLEGIGVGSFPALMAAMEDKAFPGRGYAGWALSQVMRSNGLNDEAAIRALERARADDDPYVKELARSGLSTLSRSGD